MNALIVKDKPINGILWTRILPYSQELEELLQRTRKSGQSIVHDSDFDLNEYKASPDFV